MNLVSNKTKKVFLCLDTKIYETSRVDIILSPEFYWVRIFDIPVKTLNQAKLVVPTLFEDLILEDGELSYQVIKLEENKYLCFAYLNKKIYEAIKQSGINLSLVNNIYFAQNECKDYSQFFMENKSFLYTNDGILVKVPNGVLTQKIEVNDFIDDINLTSNKIDIKMYNNFFNTKQIYFILAIFLVISFANFLKYFAYSNEINNLENKIENIKKINNLPSSMIQIDSIVNSNKKIVEKEIKKREALFYVLSNNNDIKSIEIQNDILLVSFLNVNKQKIEDYISKKYKIISSDTQNLILNVKVQL